MDIVYASAQSDQEAAKGQYHITQTARLWDRQTEGGFPGTSTKDPVRCFHEFGAQSLSTSRRGIFFSCCGPLGGGDSWLLFYFPFMEAIMQALHLTFVYIVKTIYPSLYARALIISRYLTFWPGFLSVGPFQNPTDGDIHLSI